MVHQFLAVNAATIKMNYPMKRVEPILNRLSQTRWKAFFHSDAANGYWAVPLASEYAYKTAFITSLGQFCYLRMGQGLTGAPGTYTRLKDITMGPIPPPHAEPALSEGSIDYEYFVDDDAGAAETLMTNRISSGSHVGSGHDRIASILLTDGRIPEIVHL
ncbi:uncharacterized protein N7459_007675 [Penicillium hispanicum]|uniref:uncharacterized protein n=1 Tax=Penicillium hispanicum TaxID=1080232 RepID=UPI0025415E3F|nr:uncharacterized protein N7459_007675 [Penicillium hispanicum]KAJ5578711.1 hypothetical protein N7459_007675 [Penicillium hispanicum]